MRIKKKKKKKLGCAAAHTAVYITNMTWLYAVVNFMVCKLHLNEPVKNIVITRISFEEDPMSSSPRVQKKTQKPIHLKTQGQSDEKVGRKRESITILNE